MTKNCGDCVCSAPAQTAGSGRLVLATQVDHTATALRSLALRRGTRLRAIAPGLLELYADDAHAFLGEARKELSSVEADEVRCLVVEEKVHDAALLARAMAAPSLSAAGARVAHADLLPLFADEHGSFHAVYQPILDLARERVVGHEALLRATDASGAPVFPDVLFPAAEAAGWTHVLDRVGRTTALRNAGPWLGEDMLFINFVPTSIYRPQVCLRTTEQAAREAGLRLDQLVFEVTEGHMVRDIDHLSHVFDYYRERGCRVALDDLGAGYSSLNMLIRLQPDFVKLDKEIVQALPDPVSSAVISAIVEITHAYGGKVIAECIETREQAEAAQELGVDLGQGWLFGRPVRPDVAAPAARPTVALVDPTRPDPAVAVLAPPSDPFVSPTADAVAPAVPRQALPPRPVRTPEPAELQALLAGAVAVSASGVVVVDMLAPDAPMIFVNAAFESLTGYGAAELIGRNCRLLQSAATDREAVFRLSLAVRQGVEHRCVLLNQRKDGTPWWNELHLSPVHAQDGRLTHYLGFQHDVTARIEAEQQLLHLAGHDGLTGLGNRQTLIEQLDEALARAKRESRALAVLFVDLDGFKGINDTHGHAVGDDVLVQATQRLRGALRADDLLARTGGDEFVAVLADLDPADAERVGVRVAEEAVAALQRSGREGDVQVPLSASVGVAVFPDGGHTGEQLLHAADAAMYDAKASGGATVRLGARRAEDRASYPEQRSGSASQARGAAVPS